MRIEGGVRTDADVSWALSPLLELRGVVHGLVATSDGMVRGASTGLSREEGEGASAMLSALQSAARAVAVEMSGDSATRIRQVAVETHDGFVFAVPAGTHSVLAIYANRDVDMGNVTYEMQRQVALLAEKVLHSPARDLPGCPGDLSA